MAGQKIRIRLKAYDHEVIDTSAKVQLSRVQYRYQQRRTHTV